jgi:hypothetical protein
VQTSLSNSAFLQLTLTAHRRDLTNTEKLAYLNAVKCLQAKPAITPTSVAPGVVSRYEDFIVTHIQQTFSIHFVVGYITIVVGRTSHLDRRLTGTFPSMAQVHGRCL